jgi:hypothetical protein
MISQSLAVEDDNFTPTRLAVRTSVRGDIRSIDRSCASVTIGATLPILLAYWCSQDGKRPIHCWVGLGVSGFDWHVRR